MGLLQRNNVNVMGDGHSTLVFSHGFGCNQAMWNDLAPQFADRFRVVMYDTLEDFYLAEALEYISAWRQATADNPVGICGPIGPTEQLPLVARLVNELGVSLRDAHFWGMDEWYDAVTGCEVPVSHPLSFERADRELCFDRIAPGLAMAEEGGTPGGK